MTITKKEAQELADRAKNEMNPTGGSATTPATRPGFLGSSGSYRPGDGRESGWVETLGRDKQEADHVTHV
jgi:hypothetical protein